MDNLKELIDSLKKEEVRTLKLLINRVKTGDKRLTVDLFELLRSDKGEEDDDKIQITLYGQPLKSRNKYYRLKNKLNTEIRKSLLFQHYEFDSEQKAYNLLLLAKLLRKKGHIPLSGQFLKKAQNIATKNDLFSLNDEILAEYLTLSHHDPTVKVEKIIEVRETNMRKYRRIMESEHIMARVSYQLRKSNFSKKGVSILETMKKIEDQMLGEQDYYQSPKGRERVFKLVSSTLLSTEAYAQLIEYIQREYEFFDSNRYFSKENHRTKLNMLVWLINCYIKESRFSMAFENLPLLLESMHEYNKLNYNLYVGIYYNLLVNARIYLGHSKEVVALLEELRASNSPVFQNPNQIILLLNLSNAYYNLGDTKKALKLLSKIYISPFYESMDNVFKLYIGIYEIALRYTSGDLEFLIDRVMRLENWFGDALMQAPFAKEFVSIIEEIAMARLSGKPVPQEKDYRNFIHRSKKAYLPGGNEIIHYGIWLEALYNNENYYKNLLSSLNGK